MQRWLLPFLIAVAAMLAVVAALVPYPSMLLFERAADPWRLERIIAAESYNTPEVQKGKVLPSPQEIVRLLAQETQIPELGPREAFPAIQKQYDALVVALIRRGRQDSYRPDVETAAYEAAALVHYVSSVLAPSNALARSASRAYGEGVLPSLGSVTELSPPGSGKEAITLVQDVRSRLDNIGLDQRFAKSGWTPEIAGLYQKEVLPSQIGVMRALLLGAALQAEKALGGSPPESPVAWTYKALAEALPLLWRGNTREALALLELALQYVESLDPPSVRQEYISAGHFFAVHRFYAEALAQSGRAKEGIGFYQGYIEHYPNDGGAFLALGLLYRAEGQQRSALSSLKRAAEIEPEEPVVRLELATAKSFAGQFDAGDVQRILASLDAAGPAWAARSRGIRSGLAGAGEESADRLIEGLVVGLVGLVVLVVALSRGVVRYWRDFETETGSPWLAVLRSGVIPSARLWVGMALLAGALWWATTSRLALLSEVWFPIHWAAALVASGAILGLGITSWTEAEVAGRRGLVCLSGLIVAAVGLSALFSVPLWAAPDLAYQWWHASLPAIDREPTWSLNMASSWLGGALAAIGAAVGVGAAIRRRIWRALDRAGVVELFEGTVSSPVPWALAGSLILVALVWALLGAEGGAWTWPLFLVALLVVSGALAAYGWWMRREPPWERQLRNFEDQTPGKERGEVTRLAQAMLPEAFPHLRCELWYRFSRASVQLMYSGADGELRVVLNSDTVEELKKARLWMEPASVPWWAAFGGLLRPFVHNEYGEIVAAAQEPASTGWEEVRFRMDEKGLLTNARVFLPLITGGQPKERVVHGVLLARTDGGRTSLPWKGLFAWSRGLTNALHATSTMIRVERPELLKVDELNASLVDLRASIELQLQAAHQSEQEAVVISLQPLLSKVVDIRHSLQVLDYPELIRHMGLASYTANLLQRQWSWNRPSGDSLEGQVLVEGYRHTRASGRLRPEIEAKLYHVLVEALLNVIRHAEASEVTFGFRRTHDMFQMMVKDNGKGIAEEVVRATLEEKYGNLVGDLPDPLQRWVSVGLAGPGTNVNVQLLGVPSDECPFNDGYRWSHSFVIAALKENDTAREEELVVLTLQQAHELHETSFKPVVQAREDLKAMVAESRTGQVKDLEHRLKQVIALLEEARRGLLNVPGVETSG